MIVMLPMWTVSYTHLDVYKRQVNAQYIDKFEDIAEFLKKNVKEGDIVFTMGAGDVVNINKLIVE